MCEARYGQMIRDDSVPVSASSGEVNMQSFVREHNMFEYYHAVFEMNGTCPEVRKMVGSLPGLIRDIVFWGRRGNDWGRGETTGGPEGANGKGGGRRGVVLQKGIGGRMGFWSWLPLRA